MSNQKLNPYNARKEWDSEEVTERGFVSADDSLSYQEPITSDDDGDEIEETSIDVETSDNEDVSKSDDDEIVEARSKTYKKPNYKKRYDDLKRHYDRKLAEFKSERERILAESRANRPNYTPPKTPEELATFKEEYPDVYDVVETVAHMRAQEQIDSMKTEIDRLKKRDVEAAHERAKSELMRLHPDFSEVTSSDDFHEWAKEQPNEIQNWVYRNGTNAKLAARALDLYKKDRSINKVEEKKETNVKKQQKSDERASAADAVSVAAKPEPKTSNKRIWKHSEIAAMSLKDYEKYRDEIDMAFFEGRVVKG